MLRRSRRWLTVLVALLLLLGAALTLALTLPAATLYRYYGQRLQPLRMQAIDGSIWDGRALLSYAMVPLGQGHWQIEPWSLLGGRLAGRLALDGPLIDADGRFSGNRSQIEIDDAHLRFPASLLTPVLDIPALRLYGDITIDARLLRIEQGVITSAEGKLVWADLAVGGAAAAQLGDLRVEFEPAGAGVVIGRIRDLGGPMQVRGTLELRGQHFSLQADLNARPGQTAVQEALLYVGERRPDGGSRLSVQGEINRLP